MAVFFDFLKEKKQRQYDTDVDYRERIRAHKLSVFLRTVGITIAIVVVIVIMNISFNDKIYSEIRVNKSNPISVVTGAHTENLGGKLLIYSKDGATCIDSEGKASWNQSYEMQSPVVAICQNTVAIGDYNGRTIYVANKDSILGTVKTNLPIRDISVSDNGVVAAVLDDSEVTRIFVYNGNSDTDEPIVQAKATMNKSGYPIAVTLSPNGKLMMVSYFYVDSGNMKSSIAYYNFGEVGSNEADNYVSGYDYSDTVIPYVKFMDDDSSFGVSDDRIIFFDGKEKPTNISSVIFDTRVVAVYNNEEYVGLVHRDTTGTSMFKLDIYNSTGALVSTRLIDFEYTDIIFNKDQVIIYDDNKMEIYTIKGVQKFAGSLNTNTKLIIPTNSTFKFSMIDSDSINQVELR